MYVAWSSSDSAGHKEIVTCHFSLLDFLFHQESILHIEYRLTLLRNKLLRVRITSIVYWPNHLLQGTEAIDINLPSMSSEFNIRDVSFNVNAISCNAILS